MGRTAHVAIAVVLLLGACVTSSSELPQPTTVGFIFVGSHNDLGYNQAVWEGSDALASAMPDIKVLRTENVPEDQRAEVALEALIAKGATILFATSFGHLHAAYEVARRHPEVTVLHQGGLEPEPHLPNFGTYFGAHSEALYVAGIAAGAASRSGRLGFVVAFPIPATYNNVNAFMLGARTVNPAATTTVLFTKSWCDPPAQAAAVRTLLADGVDVIAQHQDCTRTILEADEAAGIYSVGYHADGSDVAPKGWLIGAVWNWGPLYTRIVQTVLDGTFASSPYEGDFRGKLASGDNPFVLTEPGPSVSPNTRERIVAALAALRAGASPFTGPIIDRNGTARVPVGTSLTDSQVDHMDWWVSGVIGDAP